MSSGFKLQLFSVLRRCTLAARKLAIRLNLLKVYTALYETFRMPIFLLLKPKGILKVHAQGMDWFVDTEDRVIAMDLITYHAWEPEEGKLILDLLPPGGIMVDIGANIGYHALHAAKKAGPQGRVFAFEPDPHNFELLKRNIEVNQISNVSAIPCAISDKTESLKLYLSARNFGAHSIVQENVNFGRGGALDIPAYSLDDFSTQNHLTQIDLIKMDAQGAEGLILKGAGETLKNNKKLKIIMEFWPAGLRRVNSDPAALLKLLRGHGFRLSALIEEKVVPMDEDTETIRLAERHGYLTLVCKRS